MLQVLWAVCVYVEALSVFPQLRMMQNAKVRGQAGPGASIRLIAGGASTSRCSDLGQQLGQYRMPSAWRSSNDAPVWGSG